jgi:hypothetical protein
VAGDLLVAVVAHQGGNRRNLSPPVGWTAVPNSDSSNAKNVRIHAWYLIAGAGEPSSYTFALTGGAGVDIAGGIVDVSGVSVATPINASDSQSNGGPQSPVTAPSVSTTVANTLLLFGGACNAGVTFTAPAPMSEQWDIASSGSARVASEAASQQLGSLGSTGTRVATASSNCRSVGLSIAIAPS